LQYGQRKSSRFTCTRLRRGDQIPTRQDFGNRLLLDRRWGFVPMGVQSPHQCFRQTKINKIHTTSIEKGASKGSLQAPAYRVSFYSTRKYNPLVGICYGDYKKSMQPNLIPIPATAKCCNTRITRPIHIA